MCGIFASSGTNAFEKAYYGLQMLQHRGQDGFGFHLSSLQENQTHKQSGFINQWQPQNLQAERVLAHTRYSTIGSSKVEDLQPFVQSQLQICHNGNVTNLSEVKSKFPQYTFQTANDVEAFLPYFQNLQNLDDLKLAVKQILKDVKGSYAVVGIWQDKLFAFKDAYGIRPLCFTFKDGWLISSESHALHFLGCKEVENLNAGELLVLGENQVLVRETLHQLGSKPCMFEWVYFAGVEGEILGHSVYEARYNLGIHLAKALKNKNWQIDFVAPVPDTARTVALALSDEMGIPYKEVLIKNRYIQRSFILNSDAMRDAAIRLKLNPVVSQIQGKNILIVDDSIVRGATSKRIVSLLKSFGAAKVYFASACPEIKYPCFYGIDFPTKKELLASTRTLSEQEEYLQADGILYLPLESLKPAIGHSDLCQACLDGKYPVQVQEEAVLGERQ